MLLLIPPHPGCPESHKMNVCVCVFVLGHNADSPVSEVIASDAQAPATSL